MVGHGGVAPLLVVDGENDAVVHLDQCLLELLSIGPFLFLLGEGVDCLKAVLCDFNDGIQVVLRIPFESQGQISETFQDIGFKFTVYWLLHIVHQHPEDFHYLVGHVLVVVAGDVRNAGKRSLEERLLLDLRQSLHNVLPINIHLVLEVLAVAGRRSADHVDPLGLNAIVANVGVDEAEDLILEGWLGSSLLADSQQTGVNETDEVVQDDVLVSHVPATEDLVLLDQMGHQFVNKRHVGGADHYIDDDQDNFFQSFHAAALLQCPQKHAHESFELILGVVCNGLMVFSQYFRDVAQDSKT